jgi:altronate dehydratase
MMKLTGVMIAAVLVIGLGFGTYALVARHNMQVKDTNAAMMRKTDEAAAMKKASDAAAMKKADEAAAMHDASPTPTPDAMHAATPTPSPAQ